jgi:hypothetical protein
METVNLPFLTVACFLSVLLVEFDEEYTLAEGNGTMSIQFNTTGLLAEGLAVDFALVTLEGRTASGIAHAHDKISTEPHLTPLYREVTFYEVR